MSAPPFRYNPGQNGARPKGRCSEIDVHALLGRELYGQTRTSDPVYGFASSGGGVSVVPTPLPPPSDAYGFKDNNLYFESPYANGTSDRANGALSWDITAQYNGQTLSNIIELTIGSFFFPQFATIATQPDYYFFRRVYLCITDIPSSQQFNARGGRHWTFEFIVNNYSSIAVELVPVNPRFYLQSPLTTISQINAQFMIPSVSAAGLKPIPLPPDTIIATAVAGSNPAAFNVGDTSPLGPVGVPLAPGIAVFFSGFSSGNATLDSLTNTPRGYFVDNIVSATQFTVSGLNYATLGAPTQCNVLIGKNRIAFPLQFYSLTDNVTTRVQATHV